MLFFFLPDEACCLCNRKTDDLVSQYDTRGSRLCLQSWFQCINEKCNEKYALNTVIYRCRSCDSLLEVRHDMKALAHRNAKAWMKLFEDRYKSTQWPYGSGIWARRNGSCRRSTTTTSSRCTKAAPICSGGAVRQADRRGQPLAEAVRQLHSGSFKDLGMTVLVSQVKQMISEGTPIQAVACASTGDTSAALAVYCAAAGIPSIVLLPKGKISIAQLVQPIANGALVLSLDTDFDGCMRVVQEITKDETIYLANSMNSLRIEGQKTVGIEIVQQFDWEVPDVIVIPGGNLGTYRPSARAPYDAGSRTDHQAAANRRSPGRARQPALPVLSDELRVLRAMEAQKTLASAIQIGNPVSIDKAIRTLKQFDGIVMDATESELADAAALGDTTGMFNCRTQALLSQR